MAVILGSFELPANLFPAARNVIEHLVGALNCHVEDCNLEGMALLVNGHDDASIAAVLDAPTLEAMRLARNGELQTLYEEKVRDKAEEYRALFVTKRPGKQNAYQQKAPIAQRIVAAGVSPDPADIALLQNEADARTLTVAALAALIVQREAEYATISDVIEGIEAASVAAVWAIASTSDDIQGALDALMPQLLATAETALAAIQVPTL